MKFVKIAGVTVVSVILLLYLSVLFVVPNVVNLNKLKPNIQKMLNDQTGLNVDFDNAKITVTPLLSAGIKADNVKVILSDNSELLKADNLTGRISLPHLAFFNVKVTKAQVLNPKINIDIQDGKEYKIVKYIEEFNKKQENTENIQNMEQNSFDASKIKINIPEIKIFNYSLFVNDLKTNEYLKLRGDELLLAYKDGKNASLKTLAELFVNENKHITANIDIDTFLPEMAQENNMEQQKEEQNKAAFINPVAVYKAYNLNANVNSKLKIRQKDNKIVSTGYINIDDLTLMLSGVQTNKSKLHIKTNDTKVNTDTELYITDSEKLSINANIDYGKNTSIDMKIKSGEIYIDNVLKLVEAALNSANINNELNTIKAGGYFIADTNFNTDLKQINSNGSITFSNIDIKDAKNNSRIAKINSVISLDNSILKFVNTTCEVFDTVFNIDGTINQNSYADIKLTMEKMPLQKAFNLFLPKEINNAYDVNSGVINISAALTGKLKELKGKVKLLLNNVSVRDKANEINYLNNLLTADFDSDFKTFKGTISNSDFKAYMNGANINCDKISMNVGDKDIIINPAVIKINNSTNINMEGTVKNYINNPVFNIKSSGILKTADLKQLAGKDMALYLKEKGTLPVAVNITGDGKKQTISANISADANNYITPVDIRSIQNKNTVLNAIIDIKDNKITLNDTGLFVKEGNSKTEIIGIEGIITKLNTKNPLINHIKIKMPADINASLAVFPKSKFMVKGNALISGNVNNPKIKGDFNFSNISIPELFLTIDKTILSLDDKNLDLDLKRITANGSDFDITINCDLTPSKNFTIKTLNLISNLLDSDKVMKVSEELTKYTTPASNNNTSGSINKNAASGDIPVVIKDGSINIKELKSGAMTLKETSGKISMAKNIFYIKNLVTTAFQGKIKGDVSMNIITSEIKANVKGSELDVEQTLLEAANMKDTLTGTMDFDANLSLKGSTYEEQVKSLKGNVNFTMKNGSLGPLGKIENLISADNLSSSSAVKKLINTTITSTIDTSKYNTLKGHLSFNQGIAQINPITSSGDYMSAYIFGNFDVLKNTADMKLRGRLGSKVTSSMGQLAMLNPVNVVKSSSNMNMVLGSLLLTMCEKVTDAELSQIPAITKESTDANTAKFQVVIRGDASKPLKLVRSFKWLATESQIKEAKDYLGTLSVISVPKDMKEVKQQAKDILKNLTSEGTLQTKEQGKEAINAVKSLLGTQKGNTETAPAAAKDLFKQVKTNALNQLKEQAKQAVEVQKQEKKSTEK